MNTIPFLDLSAATEEIRPELERRWAAILDHGRFILGDEVAAFERHFAAYCECPHAVGMASGLDALKLALRVLGVGPGDEVITAANSFIATALAITAVGATPVLADIDPATYAMDPADVARRITPRTRALLPVHLYGHPADMAALGALAARHRLHMLEDACQAHGARFHGRRVGAMGDMAAFSFYPGKNLGGMGDGGLVTTGREDWAEALRKLRNYGSTVRYHHDLPGENSRLDTLQAAVLDLKLAHLDEHNRLRRAAAAYYRRQLQGVGDVVVPVEAAGCEPVYHLFVIRTARRDALMAHLRAAGVECLIHYPIPIHLQKAYAGAGWKEGDYPVAEQCARQILSLPIFPTITREQQDQVVAAVRAFFRG